MSWLSRSVSFFQGGEESDEEEGAASEEEEKDLHRFQFKDSVLYGNVVTKDLSELTKSLTKQLWGVASFLAPPPSPESQDPAFGDHPSSQFNGEKLSQADIKGEAKIEGKPSGNKPIFDVHFSADDGVFESHVVNLELPMSAGKQSTSEHKITGICGDLAELKGGFAKGLSHISSMIRVVSGDDLLVCSPSKVSTASRRDVSEDLFSSLLSTAPLDSPKSDSGKSTLGFLGPVNSPRSSSGKSKLGFSSKLVSHIDEFSKFASTLLPFDLDSDKEDLVEDNSQDLLGHSSPSAVDDEVIALADDIAMRPEIWLDFPIFSDEEDTDDYELSHLQQRHVETMKYASRKLAALKIELCPYHMSEERFWKIYFALAQSRLRKHDTLLSSTPQVLEVRNILLQEFQRREKTTTDSAHLADVKLEQYTQHIDDTSNSVPHAGSSPYCKDPPGETATQRQSIPSKVNALQKLEPKHSEENVASSIKLQGKSSSSRRDIKSFVEVSIQREDPLSDALMKEKGSSRLQVSDLNKAGLMKSEAGIGQKTAPASRSALIHETLDLIEIQKSTTKLCDSSAVKILSVADDDEAEVDEWLDEGHLSPDIASRTTPGVGAAAAAEDISFSDLEDEEDKSTSTSTMSKGNAVPETEGTESNDWLTVDDEDLASTGSS